MSCNHLLKIDGHCPTCEPNKLTVQRPEVIPTSSIEGRDSKGRFVKGVSGNPLGRPRNSFALTDSIRKAIDPEVVADVLYAIMRGQKQAVYDRDGNIVYGINEQPSVTHQLMAIQIARDTAFIKPTPEIELQRRIAEETVPVVVPVGKLSDEALAMIDRDLNSED